MRIPPPYPLQTIDISSDIADFGHAFAFSRCIGVDDFEAGVSSEDFQLGIPLTPRWDFPKHYRVKQGVGARMAAIRAQAPQPIRSSRIRAHATAPPRTFQNNNPNLQAISFRAAQFRCC